MYEPPHFRRRPAGRAARADPRASARPADFKRAGRSDRQSAAVPLDARCRTAWPSARASRPGQRALAELAASPQSKVLVVFQGADSYVTPSWYETKQETGKVVPTWNYVMVQVRGTVRVIEDAAWLAAADCGADRRSHEANRDEPWASDRRARALHRGADQGHRRHRDRYRRNPRQVEGQPEPARSPTAAGSPKGSTPRTAPQAKRWPSWCGTMADWVPTDLDQLPSGRAFNHRKSGTRAHFFRMT